MTLWFTSDTHFGHRNMAENFTLEDGSRARDFRPVQHMDHAMVERWNDVVKPEDHVYHLGDVSMIRGTQSQWLGGVLARLHGHKRLILGNHDGLPAAWYLANGFKKIFASRVLDNILFTHIPVHPDSLGRFRANVHGHTHHRCYAPVLKVGGAGFGLHERLIPYINICVEQTDYTPSRWPRSTPGSRPPSAPLGLLSRRPRPTPPRRPPPLPRVAPRVGLPSLFLEGGFFFSVFRGSSDPTPFFLVFYFLFLPPSPLLPWAFRFWSGRVSK